MTNLCKGDTVVFYRNISSVFLQCVHNIARWYQCSICTKAQKTVSALEGGSLIWHNNFSNSPHHHVYSWVLETARPPGNWQQLW